MRKFLEVYSARIFSEETIKEQYKIRKKYTQTDCRTFKEFLENFVEVEEVYNVIGYSGIPINRTYFITVEEARSFIEREEAEFRRLGIYTADSLEIEKIDGKRLERIAQ